jgi:hypothetical protein
MRFQFASVAIDGPSIIEPQRNGPGCAVERLRLVLTSSRGFWPCLRPPGISSAPAPAPAPATGGRRGNSPPSCICYVSRDRRTSRSIQCPQRRTPRLAGIIGQPPARADVIHADPALHVACDGFVEQVANASCVAIDVPAMTSPCTIERMPLAIHDLDIPPRLCRRSARSGLMQRSKPRCHSMTSSTVANNDGRRVTPSNMAGGATPGAG